MYLDLRQVSIEEVYQALVQKLSSTTLQKATDKLTTQGNCILLGQDLVRLLEKSQVRGN